MDLPSKITLYDAEFTVKEKTMSVYTIRLMLLLGYKKIAYETVRISFADIESTAKAIGVPATRSKPDGTGGYTIPFVVVAYPNKPAITISDSTKIAWFIEETYPDPEGKLFPSNSRVLQSMFTKYMAENVLGSVIKIAAPFLVRALPEDDGKFLVESRKSTLGKTYDEIAPQDEASLTEALRTVEGVFDDLAAHLDSVGEGNIHVANEVSYSEFELVSVLNFIKRLTPHVWRKLEGRNGGRWAKLIDLPLYKRLLPANRV